VARARGASALTDPGKEDVGRRTLRIGLTGPIGCGKSTIAGWLAELGAHVIDADRVARDVTAPGTPALDEIRARFGNDVFNASGELDRAALGRVVFGDAGRLRELEGIVHPAVRPRIEAALAQAEAAGVPAVVLEAIRLIEGGWDRQLDEVWLVTCDAASQRARLAARGLAEAEADRRIEAQRELVGRVTPRATRVIDTTGPAEAVRAAIEEALAAALGDR
jgi:dephospho-CoA kinase